MRTLVFLSQLILLSHSYPGPYPNIDYKTTGCSDVAPWSHCSLLNSFDCYKGEHREMCCSTCETFKRNIPACVYGDLTPQWCITEAQCLGENDLEDCCETCFHYTENIKQPPTSLFAPYGETTTTSTEITSVCPSIDQRLPLIINGEQLTCLQVATTHRFYCYNAQVYNSCCPSCESVKDGLVDGCGWGDKSFGSCSGLTARDCKSFYNWSLCCTTCNVITGQKGFKARRRLRKRKFQK